jgi:hypothetical protein
MMAEAFHAHLDACAQCREHPFALCEVGAVLLEASARRAPVQAEKDKPAGTIAWEEHLAIYSTYTKRYGRGQSAERIAERGGFGYYEITLLTGAPPRTWEKR